MEELQKDIKEKNSPSIAIIGGGPMGLAVSYELTKNGYKNVLLEADDRLGGMAASFDFAGLEIERYYHFHCLSDYAFFDLLRELKLFDQMRWVNTKMGFFFENKLYKWGSPLSVLRFSKISFVSRLRYLFHAARCLVIKDWRFLDKISAISWLEKWLGNECFDVLWFKLFKYKFYNYSKNISAAWIWSRIRRIGLSRKGLKEKLGYLKGGSNKWIEKIYFYLKNHDTEIRLNCAVKKITIENRKILLSYDQKDKEKFDIVISTIPLPLIGKIFEKGGFSKRLTQKYLDQISVGCVCVIVETKRPVTNNFWTNINDSKYKIPGIIEFSNLRKLKKNITYIPFYVPRENPIYSYPDEKFVSESIKCLKSINKDLKDSDVINTHCSRYAYAQPVCGTNFKENLPPLNPIENLWTADTTIYYPEDRGISESIFFGRNLAKKIIRDF